MLVSFIIPVYNNSCFLEEAVSSIRSQNVDKEIIIIDDGSTDGSGAICDKIAADQTDIRVIHTENGGVSRARNIGIENATGEYVAFLDSDDAFAENVITAELLEKGYDAVSFGMAYTTPDLRPYKTWSVGKGETVTGEYAVKHLGPSFCAFVYRSEVIERGRIRFFEGLKFAEDATFRMMALQNCQSVFCSSNTLLYYRQHDGGVTKHYSPEAFFDAVLAMQKLWQYGSSENKLEKYYRVLYLGEIWEWIGVAESAGMSGKEIERFLTEKDCWKDFVTYEECVPAGKFCDEITAFFRHPKRHAVRVWVKMIKRRMAGAVRAVYWKWCRRRER